MMTRVLTMQDVMTYFEGNAVQPSLSLGDYPSVQKSIINTGMGLGVWNPIYGAQAWYQLNTESNWFAAMPKFTWDKSGFRTINGYTRSAGSMGMSETATLPTPTIPTIEVIKINPKINMNTFQTTQVVQKLASESMDDIYGNLDVIRQFYATEHVKLLNEQIGTTAVGTSTTNSVNGSTILTLESIDRIVSSYAEGTDIGLTSSSTPTLAQVINPWYGAIDRSQGEGIYDSYVVAANGTVGAAPASPTALSDSVIRQTIQGVRINGANTNVAFTGYNTYAEIQGLYVNQVRYFPMSETPVKYDLNGIESGEGVIGGVQIATLYGIPLITAVNTPTDTGAVGKERVYFLDTTDKEGYGYGRLGVQILNPTTYLETTDRDFILLQQLAYEGLYYTIGEVVCRFPAAQAKIRDIA